MSAIEILPRSILSTVIKVLIHHSKRRNPTEIIQYTNKLSRLISYRCSSNLLVKFRFRVESNHHRENLKDSWATKTPAINDNIACLAPACALWRSRWMIKFYKMYKYDGVRCQAKTFRELFLFSPVSVFFSYFFLSFVCSRRENGDVESRRKGGTEKEVVSRCKIYDVQVSARERTNVEPRGVSSVRIVGKSTVTPTTRMSPVSILLSVRSFLPPAMAKVVQEWARG